MILSNKKNKAMMEWIAVEDRQINREVQKDIRGINVTVAFSPYDVPRRFRGYRDPITNLFIIDFEYLLDETTRPEKSSPDSPIELEIGENSKRIYRIKIDVAKLGCDAVRLEFEPLARNVIGEIQKFKSVVPEKLRERYKLAESLLFNRRNEIFSPLAA